MYTSNLRTAQSSHVPGFIEQLTLDFEETGIAHSLRKMMVGKHTFGVEVF